MTFVPLNRQFEAFRDGNERSKPYALDLRLLSGTGWPTLLEFQRVVVLAAAGSGKSRELEEQASALLARDEFAFYASVRDVGNSGLAAALGNSGAERLAAWQASDRTAWFFLDSVDEAKLDHIRFVDAMRRLADGLGEARPRARIVLSGRYANWEFEGDLNALLEALPIAMPRDPSKTDKGPLVRLLDGDERRTRSNVETEKPAVVLMKPLDLDRVHRFVEGQGVADHVEFMSALKANSVGELAQRPVDLGWLIDYWRGHQRFDTHAVMLEASLRARLIETDPQRAARVPLDVDKSMSALERIGATLVFGRVREIEIPVAGLSLGTPKAMALDQILPDWPGDHRSRLIALPVFDPSGPGRVQLHNDNEAVVRGFLAARWLLTRRHANAPRTAIAGLLFAEADGAAIVLPSAQETAAWLAIWDPDVAREIVHRDPALLLTGGDPGSLALSIRAEALARLVDQLLADEERHPFLSRETLRRFATPNLVTAMSDAWVRGKNNQRVCVLVLQLSELGHHGAGVGFAREALNIHAGDPLVQSLAARILGRLGEAGDLEALSAGLNARPPTFHAMAVWEVIEAVFPPAFTVADLLSLLRTFTPEKSRGDQGWRGEALVRKIEDATTLEPLLVGLLQILGPSNGLDATDDTLSERQFLPMIKAAAEGVLRLTATDVASDVAIDAGLRLSDAQHRGANDTIASLSAALSCSPGRRRAALWRVAEALRDHPWVQNRSVLGLGQIEYLAWPIGLLPEDEPWLMDDAGDAARRPLALEGLLRLWKKGGEPTRGLRLIEATVAGDLEAEAMIAAWRTPYLRSEAEIAFQEGVAVSNAERDEKNRERNASWQNFIDGLKVDPAQLRKSADCEPGQIDVRVYNLWKLLRSAAAADTGYAIEHFGDLGRVLGPELTAEARAAFKRFWLDHVPTLSSQRPHSERLRYNEADLIGIAGVSMVAKDDPSWAARLTNAEAERAAQYATLEFNTFPNWLLALAQSKPAPVGAVLLAEIEGQLEAEDAYGILERIERSNPILAAQCATALVERLRTGREPSAPPLARVLGVIARALGPWTPPADLIDFAIDHFNNGEPSEAGALYLGLAFRLDPIRATSALDVRLDALESVEQNRLATQVLPKVFGDRLFGGGIHPRVLPFEALERLVRIAFSTIRVEEDNVHDEVYSPDPRDDAEMARSNLFNQLLATPGRATLEGMRRLATLSGFPIPMDRMKRMIGDRAAADAEAAPWEAREALALEKQFDPAPQTPQDLQRAATGRLADLDHDLHNAEFSQAQMVKRMPLERDAQKWVANELQSRQGRAYTVMREPHVYAEKEPDIRLQSNLTAANLPIEIKLAESWTLKELEDAISVQLSGRYLRERDLRHGILLLIHRKARRGGWSDGAGKRLAFAQVVAHLRSYADGLGRGGSDAPQVEIAVIDVTDIPDEVSRRK